MNDNVNASSVSGNIGCKSCGINSNTASTVGKEVKGCSCSTNNRNTASNLGDNNDMANINNDGFSEEDFEVDVTDAVIGLPRYAVEIEVSAKIYNHETGKLETIGLTLNQREIMEAFDRFEATVSGDYPRYRLTEYGKTYLETIDKETFEEYLKWE